MHFKRIDQIRAWRLCLGCGACVSACPQKNIELIDVPSRGLRPQLKTDSCEHCGQCVKVCPGIELHQRLDNGSPLAAVESEWGPVLEVWEGYAADTELRYRASSGGLATALAHYCLVEQGFAGVLHTGVSTESPIRNCPVFSSSYEQLLERTGSRYSPAGPCEKFEWFSDHDKPSVFIGKPCDVAALDKFKAVFPEMKSNVGLSISMFCAGTPSTQGTIKAIERMGLSNDDLKSFRYRGYGWPGMAHAETETGKTAELTYDECWGQILSKHVQFRCRLCPDSTGQFADISCGDPWYREKGQNDPGRSLVIARTEKGRDMIEKAMRDGYVVLEKAAPDIIARSQASLLFKRRNLWARLLALKLLGCPTPKYKGFCLHTSWRKLSMKNKAKSFFGTLRRILQRKWYCSDKSSQTDQ